MKHLIIVMLVLLPALCQPQFETFHIISDIGLTHVSEQVEIEVSNPGADPIRRFNYTLSHDPQPVYAEVDGKKVTPRITQEGSTWTLDVDIASPSNTTRILFRFMADDLVQVLEEGRNFQFTFSPYYYTKDFQLRVVLPAGAILLEKKKAAQSQPVVFPDAGIRSDGRRVTVEWNLDGFDDDRIFLINYELPKTVPAPQPGYYWLLLLPVFIIILALHSSRVAWESTIQALDADEKKVINEVKKRPGIPQKDIAGLTGFNKVKIHRVIERMSNSNLVKVDKRSNRTRVYISENLEGSINPINSLKLFLSNLKLNIFKKWVK